MSDPAAERSRVEAEAAEWFARLSRLHITTDALRDFRAWRKSEPNAEAYARVEKAWETAKKLALDPEVRAATAEALDKHPPRPTVTWSLPPPRKLGIGLALLAATAAGALFWMHGHPQQPSYSTQVGEQRLVVLEDGSRIRLNTDSQVRIRFTPGRRLVRLTRGEAFFEAAHDATRPFIVEAGGTDVRALGTRFDVRRDARAVQVTLVEGRVQVSQDDHPATAVLLPSQQLTATAQGLTPPRATDTAQSTSWTTGRLTFHETALADAIAEVNRYGPRKIALADPTLAKAPVSGVFDAGDTDAFVAAVKLTFNLKSEPSRNGIRLLPTAAPSGG